MLHEYDLWDDLAGAFISTEQITHLEARKRNKGEKYSKLFHSPFCVTCFPETSEPVKVQEVVQEVVREDGMNKHWYDSRTLIVEALEFQKGNLRYWMNNPAPVTNVKRVEEALVLLERVVSKIEQATKKSE